MESPASVVVCAMRDGSTDDDVFVGGTDFGCANESEVDGTGAVASTTATSFVVGMVVCPGRRYSQKPASNVTRTVAVVVVAAAIADVAVTSVRRAVRALRQLSFSRLRGGGLAPAATAALEVCTSTSTSTTSTVAAKGAEQKQRGRLCRPTLWE